MGIEIDTGNMQMRLPKEKLDRLRATLELTLEKRAILKRDLQSLVGLLQHAIKVVKPGRSFIRRLHALLKHHGSGRAQNHLIRLNEAARADILCMHC